MTFSEKRASKRIKSMLVLAKQHAAKKGIDPQKMIVCASHFSALITFLCLVLAVPTDSLDWTVQRSRG